jgi:polyisoprenoid-binding protein YceI
MITQQDHAVTTPHPGRYDIDAGRSAVTFRTRHLFGLAPVRGRYLDLSVEVQCVRK